MGSRGRISAVPRSAHLDASEAGRPASAAAKVIGVYCRGVRGATTVEANTREAILSATEDLLRAILESNNLTRQDIASVIFTTTRDLNAEFPAVAAREMEWTDVPLLCGHEMNVPGSLQMCLRVLMHVNTEKTAAEMVHVYLNGAKILRPDKEDQSFRS